MSANDSVRRHSVNAVDRPLSPHLQVWAFTPTMLTSILTRVTAVGNAIGFVLIAVWTASVAAGPAWYGPVTAVLTSPVGLIFLVALTWSVSFHMLAGIRHLVWDFGIGFKPEHAKLGSYLMLCGSVLLTLLAWGGVILWR